MNVIEYLFEFYSDLVTSGVSSVILRSITNWEKNKVTESIGLFLRQKDCFNLQYSSKGTKD